MPKLRKVDGAWRTVVARYRKIAGQHRRVKESYRKVDGVWVKTFGQGLMYIQPIVNNPDPQLSDAGVHYDDASRSWKAYIYGKPSSKNTVEVGVQILNIPTDSTVSLELEKYDGISNDVSIRLYSSGIYAGVINLGSTKAYYTRQNVSRDLILYLRIDADSVSRVNYALSDVKINGVSIPLP